MSKYSWFNILFIFILLLPLLGQVFDLDKTELNENRKYKDFPVLSLDSISYFPSAFSDYYSDQFGFRKFFLKKFSTLKSKVFNISDDDKVLIGKQGWLFMGNLNGDNAYDDATHRNLLSKNELDVLKSKIEKRKLFCETNNIHYVSIYYPNPHTIYSDFLPSSITLSKKGKQSRIEQCISYLDKGKSISNILDPKHSLLEKKNQLLYYKNDTHWNEMGAFITYQFLLNQLSKVNSSLKPFEKDKFKIRWFKSLEEWKEEGKEWCSDCFEGYFYSGQKKIYLPGGLDQVMGTYSRETLIRDSVPVFKHIIPLNVLKTSQKGNKNAPLEIVYENLDNKSGPIAIIFRDSYTDAMTKFLLPHFSKIIFRRGFFDRKLIESEEPDIVIEGRVERYFPNFFK